MNKMVINHLEKLFVTSDAATIVKELEIAHPAARLVVLAAQAQEAEIGDGTNLVISLAGDLLGNAEELVRDGLHPSEILHGYKKAAALVGTLARCLPFARSLLFQALQYLEELVLPGTESFDVKNEADVSKRLRVSCRGPQSQLRAPRLLTLASAGHHLEQAVRQRGPGHSPSGARLHRRLPQEPKELQRGERARLQGEC